MFCSRASRALGIAFADPVLARLVGHIPVFLAVEIPLPPGQTMAGMGDLRRALDLRPSDGKVVLELCRYSLSVGLDDRSDPLAHLLRTDPPTPQTRLLEAMMAYYDGRSDDVAAPARRGVELAPEPSMLYVVAGLTMADAGLPDDALQVLELVMDSDAVEPHRHMAAFFRHSLDGDGSAVDALPMDEMVQGLTNEHMLRMLADGYVRLGRPEEAVRVLRAALRRGFINYPNLASRGRTLEPLRAAPQFQALLAEVEPRWKSVVEWEKGLDG